MSYTIADLITDLLPRIGKIENKGGITVFSAANSILSLIFKRLLDRKSDLLATGNLFLIIPSYDYCVPLPSGFLSLSERPRAVSAADWLTSTAWMAGTVTSYTPATKTLVLNVTSSNGAGALASWHIAVGMLPGQPVYTLDTSLSAVVVGTGAKTFVTATALSLVPGQNVVVSNEEIPSDSGIRSRLQPEYLSNDDHDDLQWWEEYRYFGETFESAALVPRRYKVIGQEIYFRPKVTAPAMVTAKYNAQPSSFTLATQSIPWDGKFDEIFREGVVRIVMKGIAIPDADQDFMAFFDREFNTLISARARMIPMTGRTKRSSFL